MIPVRFVSEIKIEAKTKQDTIIYMPNEIQPITTSITEGEIVLYQPDDTTSLEVKLEQETVWLSQAQMVELFQTSKQNVSLHINNIFKEGELTPVSTVKEYLKFKKRVNVRYNARLHTTT